VKGKRREGRKEMGGKGRGGEGREGREGEREEGEGKGGEGRRGGRGKGEVNPPPHQQILDPPLTASAAFVLLLVAFQIVILWFC
jgi:hypothetical protein